MYEVQLIIQHQLLYLILQKTKFHQKVEQAVINLKTQEKKLIKKAQIKHKTKSKQKHVTESELYVFDCNVKITL